MAETIDCVVIGAGVVGLAIARACARAGWETIVLEAETAFGTATSSRNSEVIHAGIYYPPGSIKARLCVPGRKALYAYCESHGVPYWRCGKLIVAAHAEQVEALRAIGDRAAVNGVDNLRWLTGAQARALEPALQCVAALESPSTGTIDSHSLMLALLGDLEAAGGALACQSPLVDGEVSQADSRVVLRIGGAESMELAARHVVNCAGLQAHEIARSISGVPDASIPKVWYAKGNYYALSERVPFSRLIYPVPEPGGLGVHLSLDLNRQARFGPDVEWVDGLDYDVDPGRAERFYAAIRQYWPTLSDGALHPDYAGIRPKLVGPGEPEADFLIQDAGAHGVAGLVNLYGIESPGLTACLAIADEVVDRLQSAS